jgi:phospholipid/cholesterol/gamma-HCH transport system permease protein
MSSPETIATPGWIPPALQVSRDRDGAETIAVVGAWNLRSLQPLMQALTTQLAELHPHAHWNLRALTRIDHAGALMLWRAWGGRRAEKVEMRSEHEILFSHLSAAAGAVLPQPPADWAKPAVLLGARVLSLWDHVLGVVRLLGRVSYDFIEILCHPSRTPWKEISANIYRTGAQALGITALVGFLVGVVLSYLSGQQLKTFGADIFIVNLLGVSVIRELGPVLAAILIAGRSGSAMTAQLGVMRVTEEIDAMAVMGIPHTLRLVLPKVIALAIAMPLIVLWTDAIALLGGMVAAQQVLGLGMQYFFASLPEAVPIANLWLGLAKGVVFGVLIALLACHYGLRIEPNTESLGAGTTNSVVAAITIVIIVDAIFAILFSHVGIY